ncbi:MAG TPA: dockerin type I domain-containing protein, partial [candidate division Zixibacteria bacterium]
MNRKFSGPKDPKKSFWVLLGVVICLFFLTFLFQIGKLSEVNAEKDENHEGGVVGLTVFLCGDANYDDIVDVGDVVYLVNYLYRGDPAPVPMEAGDANNDLVVDVGDVVFLINYLYRGGSTPICFPQPETYAFDVFNYEMDLLENSICDTGVTNVVWFTPVIPGLDTVTTMEGDTVTFHSLCSFQTKDGSYWRFSLPPGLTSYPGEEIGRADELDNSTTAGSGFVDSWMDLPGALYEEDGGPLQTKTIRIEGNRVQVGNKIYFFNDPTPLSPSLSDQILEAYRNQPAHLTNNQITTACNEGAESVSNCHPVSVTYKLERTWWTGTMWCHRSTEVTFTFEHSWTYYCPSGPLQRKIIARFEGKEKLICGSQTLLDEEFKAT